MCGGDSRKRKGHEEKVELATAEGTKCPGKLRLEHAANDSSELQHQAA